ncbi:MAG: AP2/ERF family transcription factor, partial [Planctomycetota bacterium]
MGDLIRRLGDALLGQPTERQLATNCEEVEEVVTPRKPRKSPYRNVAWHRTGKWIAKIHLREHPVHGEVIVHLGYYTDPEDAARVVDVAKMILADLGILRKWDGQCNLDGEP